MCIVEAWRGYARTKHIADVFFEGELTGYSVSQPIISVAWVGVPRKKSQLSFCVGPLRINVNRNFAFVRFGSQSSDDFTSPVLHRWTRRVVAVLRFEPISVCVEEDRDESWKARKMHCEECVECKSSGSPLRSANPWAGWEAGRTSSFNHRLQARKRSRHAQTR